MTIDHVRTDSPGVEDLFKSILLVTFSFIWIGETD